MKTFSKAFILAVSCLMGACTGPGLTVVPQDSHSLRQYALGLGYLEQGRYLLARESFSLAKASARNDDMRRRCELELAAVERAIKNER